MKRLNLVVLRCRDMEKSRAFYEALGMSFTREAHGKGPEHYACADDRGTFELYPETTPNPGDRTGLGFAVADLDGAFAKIASLGLAPEPIAPSLWGRSFTVRDPDQRRVQVQECRE